jgi:mannose-6-phosphate isomerase-like protein (cupin superfamily)
MQFTAILAIILLVGQTAAPTPPAARTQRRPVGNATLAITVSDPSGGPLADVSVTVEGPISREVRTERGRIALENLPFGTYRLRFDREGFLSFEREVVARTGTPIDVKVTLTPAPAPPPAPPPPPVERKAPESTPPPALSSTPVAIDMTTFIEKNYVGRGSGKVSPLACATGGPATLIQVKDPITEHTHADADEFLYTIAGEGSVRAGGKDQPLRAGLFMMVPRGVPHLIVAITRNPLVLLSIKAGEHCATP